MEQPTRASPDGLHTAAIARVATPRTVPPSSRSAVEGHPRAVEHASEQGPAPPTRVQRCASARHSCSSSVVVQQSVGKAGSFQRWCWHPVAGRTGHPQIVTLAFRAPWTRKRCMSEHAVGPDNGVACRLFSRIQAFHRVFVVAHLRVRAKRAVLAGHWGASLWVRPGSPARVDARRASARGMPAWVCLLHRAARRSMRSWRAWFSPNSTRAESRCHLVRHRLRRTCSASASSIDRMSHAGMVQWSAEACVDGARALAGRSAAR